MLTQGIRAHYSSDREAMAGGNLPRVNPMTALCRINQISTGHLSSVAPGTLPG